LRLGRTKTIVPEGEKADADAARQKKSKGKKSAGWQMTRTGKETSR